MGDNKAARSQKIQNKIRQLYIRLQRDNMNCDLIIEQCIESMSMLKQYSSMVSDGYGGGSFYTHGYNEEKEVMLFVARYQCLNSQS